MIHIDFCRIGLYYNIEVYNSIRLSCVRKEILFIAGKRKDKKGRVLKSGESQRADGRYCFRFMDLSNNRKSVYAPTLDELRRKEAEIQRDIADGINHSLGEITVNELIEKYMNTRRNLKTNSLRAYSTPIARLKTDPFGQRKINTVKMSDAKQFFVQLHDEGYLQNTIGTYRAVLRPAFQLAVDDDAIRKNPFDFPLSDVVPNDAQRRTALTKEQEQKYLNFVEGLDGTYFDDIVILFGTGLRVSELYGLTKADVDFSKECIVVNKQLCRTGDKPYFIDKPKTDSGYRTIPMTDKVYNAFQRVLAARSPKIEYMVDGVNGFVFLDKDDRPKTAMHLENYMRYVQKKFIKQYGKTIPNVTPHVCRHTFCTRCQQSGIDCKSLQFLMGHSNVSVTLDTYTHNDYAHTERAFREIASCI